MQYIKIFDITFGELAVEYVARERHGTPVCGCHFRRRPCRHRRVREYIVCLPNDNLDPLLFVRLVSFFSFLLRTSFHPSAVPSFHIPLQRWSWTRQSGEMSRVTERTNSVTRNFYHLVAYRRRRRRRRREIIVFCLFARIMCHSESIYGK